jgi:hypothetical protein
MPLRASGLVPDRRMVRRLPLLAQASAIEIRCAASARCFPGLSGSVCVSSATISAQ